MLKLWLGLRQLGQVGISRILDGAIERSANLRRLLGSISSLVVRSGDLHLLAMTPAGLSAEQADRWSRQTRQQLLSDQLMHSRPLYQGRHHLKAVLGNPNTQPEHLERLTAIVAASIGGQP